MALSGVSIQDIVVDEFNNIKLKHKYKYIQMKLSDDWKTIEMDKTVESSSYEDFLNQLPAKDCRYAVFDYHFEAGDAGSREQLIFIQWCPETASVKAKMLYASSRDYLRKKLVGINTEFQATDRADIAEREIADKLRNKIIK